MLKLDQVPARKYGLYEIIDDTAELNVMSESLPTVKRFYNQALKEFGGTKWFILDVDTRKVILGEELPFTDKDAKTFTNKPARVKLMPRPKKLNLRLGK